MVRVPKTPTKRCPQDDDSARPKQTVVGVPMFFKLKQVTREAATSLSSLTEGLDALHRGPGCCLESDDS